MTLTLSQSTATTLTPLPVADLEDLDLEAFLEQCAQARQRADEALKRSEELIREIKASHHALERDLGALEVSVNQSLAVVALYQ